MHGLLRRHAPVHVGPPSRAARSFVFTQARPPRPSTCRLSQQEPHCSCICLSQSQPRSKAKEFFEDDPRFEAVTERDRPVPILLGGFGVLCFAVPVPVSACCACFGVLCPAVCVCRRCRGRGAGPPRRCRGHRAPPSRSRRAALTCRAAAPCQRPRQPQATPCYLKYPRRCLKVFARITKFTGSREKH